MAREVARDANELARSSSARSATAARPSRERTETLHDRRQLPVQMWRHAPFGGKNAALGVTVILEPRKLYRQLSADRYRDGDGADVDHGRPHREDLRHRHRHAPRRTFRWQTAKARAGRVGGERRASRGGIGPASGRALSAWLSVPQLGHASAGQGEPPVAPRFRQSQPLRGRSHRGAGPRGDGGQIRDVSIKTSAPVGARRSAAAARGGNPTGW
jgi:hypothetical protein